MVSRATGAAGTGGDDNSYDASISADGRFVAYESAANNLSADDNNTYYNIFVRDLQENTTILVSRAAGAGGTGADGESYDPTISADGRKVGFESQGDNLSTEDNNTYQNAFLRNLDSNDSDARQPDDGAARPRTGPLPTRPRPPTGARVVFRSGGDNLSTEDDNGYTNVFVRDLSTNTTTFEGRGNGPDGVAPNCKLVHRHDLGERPRGWRSGPSADNISSEDNNAYSNVFVRDLVSATTTFASRATGAGGPAADGDSFAPTISANAAARGLRLGRRRVERRRQQHVQQRIRPRHRRAADHRRRQRRRERHDEAARRRG